MNNTRPDQLADHRKCDTEILRLRKLLGMGAQFNLLDPLAIQKAKEDKERQDEATPVMNLDVCICQITAFGKVDNPKCPECFPLSKRVSFRIGQAAK